VQEETIDEEVKLTFLQKLTVGGLAGILGSAIIFPVDTVKSILMAQKPQADGGASVLQL
jgi:hypothetical protein